MYYNKQTLDEAFAPYNFVPLNDKFVEVDVLDFGSEIAKNSSADGLSKFSKNSGFIDLEIKTLTPLFIGDSAKNTEKIQEFFNVNGEYKIPGSSLRGMVRNLVEICSYSKFTSFNDHKFYFRDIAGKSGSSLKSYYSSIMTGFKDVVLKNNTTKKLAMSKAKAGFLQQISDREFQIVHTTYKKQLFKEDPRYENRPISDWPEMTIKIYNKKYEVYVGKMKNTKRFYCFEIPEKNAKRIPLKYDDIKNYDFDNKGKPQRKSFLNLTDYLRKKKLPIGIPCFYTEYKGKIFFGHTPYFRVPYQNSVGDVIPPFLKDSPKFDLAEAIFGKDKVLASRVYFEDGTLQNEAKFLKDQEIILLSPKPTSYNLYLDQSSAKSPQDIKHYDSPNAKIKGYKLYHHQNNYKIPNNLKDKTNLTKTIKPLDKGNVFKARIGFESLSNIELGALMFVLNLPKDYHYKLGMAKPLGLGSVEIKAKLNLFDLDKRYSKFMDENAKFSEPLKENSKDFSQDFQKFILEKIGSQNNSLWNEDRLKELLAMLKFDLKNSYDYMELGEFKHKDKILPQPTKVRQQK